MHGLEEKTELNIKEIKKDITECFNKQSEIRKISAQTKEEAKDKMSTNSNRLTTIGIKL